MKINTLSLVISFSLLLLVNSLFCQIRILLTAALPENKYELRKQQYIRSMNRLIDLGYNNFYIVEALKKKGPTFFDDYTKNTFYSTLNNSEWIYPGANEGPTLLDALNYFQFDPDDMIIKLTGRYYALSDSFFKLVADNEQNYDVIAKADIHNKGDIATLCFAMRFKHLKKMLESLDFNWIGKTYYSIELAIGQYITQNKLHVLYVDKLDIQANIYGGSHMPDIVSDWFWVF